MTLIANGRIWIETEDGPFLGYGRIELLQKIQRLGSIRKAAAEMKLSYRQAWDFIHQMNNRVGAPLVISERGGKGGGGATLTPEGEKAIQTFHELDARFQQFLSQAIAHMNSTAPEHK